MRNQIRPLPKVPLHPIYKYADESVRQYLLLWNMVNADDKPDDQVDYIQIAVGAPSSTPQLIISSRAHIKPSHTGEITFIAPGAQLGLLALDESTALSLAEAPADADLNSAMESLLSSLLEGRQPWIHGSLEIDGVQTDANTATGSTEWICISSTPQTSIAVVGRNVPVGKVKLSKISDHIMQRMTQPGGQVISEYHPRTT